MNDKLTMTRAEFGKAVYTAVIKHSSIRVGGHLMPYGTLAGESGAIQYAWDILASTCKETA